MDVSNEVVRHGTAAIKAEGRLETANCFLVVETEGMCNATVHPKLAVRGRGSNLLADTS